MSPRIKPVIAFSIIIFLVIIVAGAFKLLGRDNVEINPPKFGPGGMPIQTFEECVAAGNPVMEIYPPQCRTKDGKVFMEQIKSKNTCGNGACEGVACMAIGCPEPETPENCPADCKEESVADLSDETADWQTYRNDEFGLEMKYPASNWSFSSDDSAIFIEKRVGDKGGLNQIIINRIANEENKNLGELAAGSEGVLAEELKKGSKININNIEGIKTSYKGGTTVYFINSRFIFEMSLAETIYNNPEFQKILSTFKFIN